MPNSITINCPPELAGVMAQFESLPHGAARAQAASALYATIGTFVAMVGQTTDFAQIPLTEVQQVVYDLIEERGVVKLDDIVRHLELVGVSVDRRSVQRWCADNSGKPGPLRICGVVGGPRGFSIQRGCPSIRSTPVDDTPPPYIPHPLDVLIFAAIKTDGAMPQADLLAALAEDTYTSQGKDRHVSAGTLKRRLPELIAYGSLSKTAAGYLIGNSSHVEIADSSFGA